MVKFLLKKWHMAAIVGLLIIGGGWSLTTQAGSNFLANNSALFVKSWGEVFGGAMPAQGSDILPPQPIKTSVTACWDTEREDLAKLSGLLKQSNDSLVDLTHKLSLASATCPTEQPAVVPVVRNIIPDKCSFPSSGDLPGAVVINEIAWMGSVPVSGESSAKAGNREWIELKNISSKTVALNGWQLADSAGNLQVVFGADDSVPGGGFYLLSRSGNAVAGVDADKAYAGGLSNSGDAIALFDDGCGVSDFLDAANAWPAGNNTTKQTMERTSDGVWQTSARPGGTPKAENSGGLAKYSINVAIQGDGSGSVVSAPAGISCDTIGLASGGSHCSVEVVAGTVLTLSAKPGNHAKFGGWSGACSGSSKCKITVAGTVSVNAIFTLGIDESETELLASNDLSTSSAHLLISDIQIAGASSANDFVKIYNPASVAVDISGWKLRKKSSTGSDASLREFPKGTSIAAGGFFTWANSANGFAQSIYADASSSQTLSADNSVALFDAAGGLVDAVAWGTGTGQYVEGSAYPINPGANEVLGRKQAAVGFVDTDDNASDFAVR